LSVNVITGVAGIALYAIMLAASHSVRRLTRRRARTELAAVPPLRADSLEGAIVRVTGTVRATGATIVAPLSGVECVAARASAMMTDRVSPGLLRPRVWFEIVPFALDRDGEPPVIVDGDHARLDLEPMDQPVPKGWAPAKHRQRMELREVTRQRERELLGKLELPRTMSARFEEKIVRAGTRVSIAGVFMLGEPSADEGERGFRELGPASLRITGDANHPLIIGQPVIDPAS
jgi:hypothetical protein